MANNTSTIYYLNDSLEEVPKDKATIVKKVIHERCRKYDLVNKEVHWLKKLESFDRVPTVISFTDDTIIMNYMGEVISKHNIPKDWKNQIEYLVDTITRLGVSHNDIKRGEILVRDGKLNLIDFQHATNTREEFEMLRKLGKTTVRNTIQDDYTMLREIIGKLIL